MGEDMLQPLLLPAAHSGCTVSVQKLLGKEDVEWTTEENEKFKELKSKLVKAPLLTLPDLKKEIYFYVNTEEGITRVINARKRRTL